MHKTTGTKLIGLTNPHNEPNWVVNVEARLDTGATRSSIDEGFISLLRLEELINEDAYDKGWLFKIMPDNQADIESLLSLSAYEASLDE